LGGRLAFLVVSITAALVVAAAAFASGTDKEPRHYTAADQAVAHSIVLTQSDVGSAWKGGAKKVDTSAPPTCPNFDPKQSDLLVTGDAESMFSDDAAGVQYDSEAQVLQTAHMVQLDWQRSIPQPGLLPCLHTILAKSLPADERIVSVTRVSIPKLATYSAEIRVVIDVHSKTAPKDVLVMLDEVLVGRNRTEITLSTAAPYAARGPVEQSELRLAKLLVSRAPATA
jgi:hypothetical protein